MEEFKPRFIERGIVEKAKSILDSLGVSDYTFEERLDGLHIYINLPPEHIETRIKQVKSLGGYLDPTTFQKTVIIPLMKRLEKEGINYKFVNKNTLREEEEILIPRK